MSAPQPITPGEDRAGAGTGEDFADLFRRRAILDDQTRAAEKAREQDAIESHPLWGMF